jgi:hypothetical protein
MIPSASPLRTNPAMVERLLEPTVEASLGA